MTTSYLRTGLHIGAQPEWLQQAIGNLLGSTMSQLAAEAGR
jgi:hypothetical protein